MKAARFDYLRPGDVGEALAALANAEGAKGAAGALDVTFYYVDASLGSVHPGFAWQAWGWPGVTVVCTAALVLGLLADGLLCG